MPPRVSVLMPVFEQARFIARAVASLEAQTLTDWELIVIDDGSRDGTADSLAAFLDDGRIQYHRLPENRGLGAALNVAVAASGAPLIAYLPADDAYYREHLADLAGLLEANPAAIGAYSGVTHHYNRTAAGAIDGHPLQLVQVMHRRSDDRWLERGECVTDDLDVMFWHRLRARGALVSSGRVTAEWVDHPGQRHKIIQEPEGGINRYRQRYRVTHPLRFASSVGNRIDEEAHYRRFRERPDTPPAPDGLKILLVGELAYNPERVLALEERGHTLFGLWMREPYWYNTVGPLPFGHVQDLPARGWREAIRRLQPDVIYALLNWQAVPFAHEVLAADTGIPFVWHFKEGPFICRENGTWDQLIDLYHGADGVIFCSPEMRQWFVRAYPALAGRPSLDLDGDLPKADWFDAPASPRLSDTGGELHTMVPGRPIGLTPERTAALAAAGIHLHLYGDFTRGQWVRWIERTQLLAPRHLHLHPTVDQDGWVEEFSRYDAGWLHFFASQNGGDLARATWDDLNYPARLATLAGAGLPLLQARNDRHLVASQTLVRDLDIGVFFTEPADLAALLHDRTRMDVIRANVWRERRRFTFDAHADRLIDFFRQVTAEGA